MNQVLLFFILTLSYTQLSAQNVLQAEFLSFINDFECSVEKTNGAPGGRPYFFIVDIASFEDSTSFNLVVSNNFALKRQKYYNAQYYIMIGQYHYLLEPSTYDSVIATVLGFEVVNEALMLQVKEAIGYFELDVLDGYDDWFIVEKGKKLNITPQ